MLELINKDILETISEFMLSFPVDNSTEYELGRQYSRGSRSRYRRKWRLLDEKWIRKGIYLLQYKSGMDGFDRIDVGCAVMIRKTRYKVRKGSEYEIKTYENGPTIGLTVGALLKMYYYKNKGNLKVTHDEEKMLKQAAKLETVAPTVEDFILGGCGNGFFKYHTTKGFSGSFKDYCQQVINIGYWSWRPAAKTIQECISKNTTRKAVRRFLGYFMKGDLGNMDEDIIYTFETARTLPECVELSIDHLEEDDHRVHSARKFLSDLVRPLTNKQRILIEK